MKLKFDLILPAMYIIVLSYSFFKWNFNWIIQEFTFKSKKVYYKNCIKVAQHQFYDMIMVVAIKEILLARTNKDDLESHKVITNITHCLRTTVRCYPTKDISVAIKSLQLAI